MMILSCHLKDNNYIGYEQWLNYHPSLLSMGDPDMADALLRDEVANREKFLQIVLHRMDFLKNSKPSLHYFQKITFRF